MALTGSYVALSKPLAMAFPVFLLVWLRFAIGALAMLGWLRKPAAEPALPRRTQALLFLHALLGNFFFTLCMVEGVRRTGATSAGVILASIPAWIALLSWALLRERVAARTWIAVALAVGAITLYALARPHDTLAGGRAAPWAGYLLLLIAALCEACYSVIGKKISATLSPRRISALLNLWGLALSTPLGLYAAWSFDFTGVGAGLWLLLVFYALAACMWSVWLWMSGLSAIPAAQAGVFTVVLPIAAALVGMLALGERLSGVQLLALGIAVASVLLATLPSRLALRVGRDSAPARATEAGR